MLKMMNDSTLPCTEWLNGLSYEQLCLIVSAFNHAREGIMVVSSEGVIQEVNSAFSRITGFEASEVIGKENSVLASDVFREIFHKFRHVQGSDSGCWTGEILNKRKNGEIFPLLLSINSIHSVDGKLHHFVTTLSDISANKTVETQLKKMAYYDILTGLPNRQSLLESLKQAMLDVETKQSFMGLAFVDLDGFKEINDGYGHVAGDSLLIDIANRVKEFIRKSDVFARLGGDEFVLLLSDLDSRVSAEFLIKGLLQVIQKELSYESENLQVSASIGLVFYDSETISDVNALLHKADVAMYKAKEKGKNTYYVLD